MSGTIYTGVIEGVFTYAEGNDLRMIPLQDTIQNVTFNYTGEIQEVQTFGARGTRRTTGACLVGESASFEFSTSNITLGSLQLAAATLKEEVGDSVPVAETFVTPTGGVLNLSAEVFGDGSDIRVADAEGNDIAYTFATGTPDTVTITTPSVGLPVTVYYNRVSANENVIRLGSGPILPEMGIYGRFYGCPGSLLIHAERVIITPNISFAVGENPASISWTGTVLADPSGTLATITELPAGQRL